MVSLSFLLGLGKGEQALPTELVSAQLRAARGGYPLVFGCTVLAASLITFTATDPRQLIPFLVALLLVSCWTLAVWRRNQAKDWQVEDARKEVLSTAGSALVTAMAWGLLLCGAIVDNDVDTVLDRQSTRKVKWNISA